MLHRYCISIVSMITIKKNVFNDYNKLYIILLLWLQRAIYYIVAMVTESYILYCYYGYIELYIILLLWLHRGVYYIVAMVT